MLLRTALPILAVAAGVATYNYLKATKPEIPKRPPREQAFTVNTTKVQLQTIQPTISLFGTTVAGRQVEIRALVAGRVVATGSDLQDGGTVAKGDLLVEIDPFDYRAAVAETEAQIVEAKARLAELEASLNIEETNLRHAREQLKLAEKDLGRAEPLVRQGVLSRRATDDREGIVVQRRQAADLAQNNIAVWKARADQQRATIARLTTALERNRQRLEDTRLSAPFDAYVSDVGAQVGRMVSVNDRVATLYDRNWIDVRLTLSDDQYGRITGGDGKLIGRKVDVVWKLGPRSVPYTATIDRVAPRIASDSGGVEVIARIDEPTRPLPLRPGAFVEVKVPDTRFEDVIAIPATALFDGDTVYAVEKSRLQPKRVERVGSDGDRLLVKGELKSGDEVLVTRVSTPGAGVLVKVVKQP